MELIIADLNMRLLIFIVGLQLGLLLGPFIVAKFKKKCGHKYKVKGLDGSMICSKCGKKFKKMEK